MRIPRRTRGAALSALQLIVVLAIFIFAAAFALPAVSRVREAAAQAQSTNNLKQLALAMHAHHDVYKALPPGVGTNAGQSGPTHFHILPFIDQEALSNAAQGASWKNGTYGAVLRVYLDPRDETSNGHRHKNWLATTNYPVNWLVVGEGNRRLAAIADGTSNTLMFAQRYQICNGQPTAWGYPAIYTWAPIFAYYSEESFQAAPRQEHCDPARAQALGRDILVAFCDGTVRSISETIRPTTWYYVCDPSDGNSLPNDF
jgi:hypothetical protein